MGLNACIVMPGPQRDLERAPRELSMRDLWLVETAPRSRLDNFAALPKGALSTMRGRLHDDDEKNTERSESFLRRPTSCFAWNRGHARRHGWRSES
jgi:hypothetical protein